MRRRWVIIEKFQKAVPDSVDIWSDRLQILIWRQFLPCWYHFHLLNCQRFLTNPYPLNLKSSLSKRSNFSPYYPTYMNNHFQIDLQWRPWTIPHWLLGLKRDFIGIWRVRLTMITAHVKIDIIWALFSLAISFNDFSCRLRRIPKFSLRFRRLDSVNFSKSIPDTDI